MSAFVWAFLGGIAGTVVGVVAVFVIAAIIVNKGD